MRDAAASILGAALNLLVLCAPLALAPGALAALASAPRGWLLCALLAAASLAEGYASLRVPPRATEAARAPLLPYATGAAILCASWIALWNAVELRASVGILAISGAVLVVLGIALRVSAILALGDRFVSHVALFPDHTLETRGLYARMRHPSEAGLLAICAGVALISPSPLLLAVLGLLILPLTLCRVRLEDAALAGRFGAAFDAWRATTPGLLPVQRAP